jgi:hypothetical protein
MLLALLTTILCASAQVGSFIESVLYSSTPMSHSKASIVVVQDQHAFFAAFMPSVCWLDLLASCRTLMCHTDRIP